MDGQDVLSFLPTLSKFADLYTKLLDTNLEGNIEIRKRIQRINEFEARTAYPFLLYIYRDYEQDKYNAHQFSSILQIIENYLVRRFVCKIDSKSLNKIFYSLYNQVSMHEADQSIQEITSYFQNRSYPKDSEFTTSLKENHFYGQGDRRKKGAHILKVIEESYSHKEQGDLTNATVEHIMPQTLTDKWMDELGENAETIHSIYLHTLGNLTLTAYNSELSNEPFLVKKKYYMESNFQMNKYIANFGKWDKESIEARVDSLTERILTIWPYFGNEKNELRKITGSSPRLLTILGETNTVKSWRDVMEKTIVTIYEDDHNKYQHVMNKYPDIISVEGEKMRNAKKASNGHYIEVNLNSKSIHDFCVNAMKSAGYLDEDWHVEIERK